MIWRVHIICFIRCIHDHSWYKIPSAKNNKFNKITESELMILPKIFRQKKNKFLASEFNLPIPIKEHPFSAINRINNFLLKFDTTSKSTINRTINPKPYTKSF
jgi:hypothetical protein